jgi:2-polyprenyl-3-methyl-5-hydroxy-6-metoxy-1,4-benzoquinol methylase
VGRRAIAVGCGLGADDEHVARLRFDMVAFDVAPTAVAMAQGTPSELTGALRGGRFAFATARVATGL